MEEIKSKPSLYPLDKFPELRETKGAEARIRKDYKN